VDLLIDDDLAEIVPVVVEAENQCQCLVVAELGEVGVLVVVEDGLELGLNDLVADLAHYIYTSNYQWVKREAEGRLIKGEVKSLNANRLFPYGGDGIPHSYLLR
jgi:hypothetical protein